jgi:alkane 1-monooxygenase
MTRRLRLIDALPFWLSLTLPPLVVLGALQGGWTVVLAPLVAWSLFSTLDLVTPQNHENVDPETPEVALFWYRLITLIWWPVQFVLLLWLLWYVPRSGHSGWEALGLFFGMGVVSGTIGINYAHELIHQRARWERAMGDLLLAGVLYSHFRSEHLRVHHLHVATPRDTVTARYNEGFHRFFWRVLQSGHGSAFRGEAMMLARRGLEPWDKRNPFWVYIALQAGMVILAVALGGWIGLGLFLWQALVAVWQLELVNYVEHYGMTRRHLGDGKYEPVRPHHSWNADHRVTNWLLINLQRHSDHHVKPDRRFPLLQTYDPTTAPQLPHGYPVMTALAMVPPLWRRRMNPRVREWRRRHYPDVTDWAGYNAGTNPLPKGA